MKLTNWFNWKKGPHLKVYEGIGNRDELIIWGHAFKSKAFPRSSITGNYLVNAFEMLKRYLLKPMAGATVRVADSKMEATTRTLKDGFFELRIKNHNLAEGVQQIPLALPDDEIVTGTVYIIDRPKNMVISDIDDTFLVSHSTNMWKQLYLLLTKNPTNRKPFEGVQDFYAELREKHPSHLPFIYVSSSEWNLYDFIYDFCDFHDLPDGVFMLRTIQTSLIDLLRSGKGNHFHKEDKISQIFQLFPESTFTLVGDSGQKDPVIYKKMALEHPEKIKEIYIRDVKKSRRALVHKIKDDLQAEGIKMELFG